MNTLYPIIRRKRRPLVEVEATPASVETEKGPGGEQVQGAPAAVPDANTTTDTKTDHAEADHS